MTTTNETNPEMIEVSLYDDEVGDYYSRMVPKKPVSDCVLCGCAGCLSDTCCEHLEYWRNEHGQPARYQVSTLMSRINNLEKLVKQLEQNRADVANAIQAFIGYKDPSRYKTPEEAILLVLRAALEENISESIRMFCRPNEHLCDACGCKKCAERLLQAVKNKYPASNGYTPLPECCGHKSYLPADLPF